MLMGMSDFLVVEMVHLLTSVGDMWLQNLIPGETKWPLHTTVLICETILFTPLKILKSFACLVEFNQL